MSRLSAEIRNVQNPALGAYIIWNFTRGYYAYQSTFVPFPLLFIVLPMIFRKDISQLILSTRRSSGLRSFANKFVDKQILKNDIISQIQTAALDMKELTLASIQIAIGTSLIYVDCEQAFVFPISTKEHKGEPKNIADLGQASERLGYWCAQLTMFEISNILRVRF